jgi:hypothetical protein
LFHPHKRLPFQQPEKVPQTPVPIVSTGLCSAAENLDAGSIKHQNAFEGSFRVTAFFHQKLFRLKLVIASL